MNNDPFSSKLEELKVGGLLRKPLTFEENDGRTVTFEGKKYLLFCSNDYLGLSHNPEVIAALHEGLDKYGAGSGASRLVSGTTSPHAELEKTLAEFLKIPAVLLFSSGYSANTGIIPAITGKGDVILADKLNHASLLDGCLLSKAGFKRYPHRDMTKLEKLLVENRGAKNRWVITDGLFSMDGDLAPLPEICGLAKKYDAKIYLDDAHAFGILGANGRGTPEFFGVEGKIDLVMGTLGKAAGGMGAFVAGSKVMIDYLLNMARTFIYSTAMPPANAYGSVKAVGILSELDGGRKEFLAGCVLFQKNLADIGLATSSFSYIIPLVIGNPDESLGAGRSFWNEGIYIQAIRPPTVPEGSSRLRLTLSIKQAEEDRQKVLALIQKNCNAFKQSREVSD